MEWGFNMKKLLLILLLAATCLGGGNAELSDGKLLILSEDSVNTMQVYRDNINAYIDWTDGVLYLEGGNIAFDSNSYGKSKFFWDDANSILIAYSLDTNDIDVNDITAVTVTASGAITGGSLTDGTATLTGGNLTGMGNITGTDVDLALGTGDILTTGTLGAGATTVTSLNAGSGAIQTTGLITGGDFKDVTQSLGTPTYSTYNDFFNSVTAVGRKTGGLVTVGTGETVNVAAGTGFIKATDDDNAQVMFFDWVAVTDQAIATDTVRYVGVEYNEGSPRVTVRTTDNFDLDTDFPLAKVINTGGSIHILNNPWWVTDGMTNTIERFQGLGHLVRDEHVGGLILSVTGTRSISITAGTLWSRLNEFPISALNSNTPLVTSHSATFDVDNGSSRGTITAAAGTPYSGLSAGDKFYITGTGDNDGYEKVYSVTGGNVITTTTVIAGTDGVEATTVLYPTFEVYSYVGGVWGDTNVYQYPVTYWNDVSGAGVLTELGVGKFMNYWVYAEADDDEIALVYGQAEYPTSAQAESEAPPSFISTHHSESSKLLGRILIKKATDTPVSVQTVFTTQFTAALAADHGNLAGLADDDHSQYWLAGAVGRTDNFLTSGTLGAGTTTLTGHLLFTDNTYDIGASGATRPRTIYAATSIVTPNINGIGASIAFNDINFTDVGDITAAGAVQGATVTGTTSVVTGTGGINVNGGTGSLVAIKANADSSASGFRIIDLDTAHVPLFAWQANDVGFFQIRAVNVAKIVFQGNADSYIINDNFGLGTSSPDTKLQVVGAAKIGDDNTNYVTIGTTGNQTFTGSAGFYPRTLNQSAEPAAGTGATQLDTGEMCIWTDTNDSKCYFCYNHGGTVKTVEMN